jgi:hypothetical protein
MITDNVVIYVVFSNGQNPKELFLCNVNYVVNSAIDIICFSLIYHQSDHIKSFHCTFNMT